MSKQGFFSDNEQKGTTRMTTHASTKRLKFIQLAEKRTTRALKAISLIGNLGNRAAYECNDADVSKIIDALLGEVERVKTKMTPRSVQFRFEV